jgi:hypothetical protein
MPGATPATTKPKTPGQEAFAAIPWESATLVQNTSKGKILKSVSIKGQFKNNPSAQLGLVSQFEGANGPFVKIIGKIAYNKELQSLIRDGAKEGGQKQSTKAMKKLTPEQMAKKGTDKDAEFEGLKFDVSVAPAVLAKLKTAKSPIGKKAAEAISAVI